jgi:hypothetical protein
MSLASDTLYVIDDYTPKSDYRRRSALERAAAQIIRQIGNQDDRYRMNRDTSLRETNNPQALVISTGEMLPSGQSETARYLAIELKPGNIDLEKLSSLQEDSEQLAHAMSGYILYIRDHWEKFQRELPEKHRELRQKLVDGNMHLRLPNAIASLMLGFELLLDYALDLNVISQTEREALRQEGIEVFEQLGRAQTTLIERQDPVKRFLGVLFELLDQGTIRLDPIESPKDPVCRRLSLEDNGELVGFYNDYYIYLMPHIAFNKIAQFCQREGHPFPVDNGTLRRLLLQEGYLKGGDKGHMTNIKTIQGERRRYVTLVRSQIEVFFNE